MKVYIKSAFDSKKLTKRINDARTSHLFELLDKQSKLEQGDYNNSVRNYNKQMASQIIAKIEKFADRKLSKLNKEINAVLSDAYSDTRRREIFSNHFFIDNFFEVMVEQLPVDRYNHGSDIEVRNNRLMYVSGYTSGVYYVTLDDTGNLTISINKDRLYKDINSVISYNNTPDTRIMSEISEAINKLGDAVEYALEDRIREFTPDLH